MALRNTFALVCLLVLSTSGGHERTAVCTLVFCEGLVKGGSAVRYVSTGYRSLVYAMVLSIKYAGTKTKNVQKKAK